MQRATADVHESVAERLRGAKQLYTSGRRELIGLLLSAGRPVTIPELLDDDPKLTQSSVYRNMAELEQVGIIVRISGTGNRTRFELNEEFTGHHHHMVCTECGRVEDFTVPAETERSLDSVLRSASRRKRFRPQSHRLDLLGICARCG
jgi:Fe2+ or Zn2+ uptake regulation protein